MTRARWRGRGGRWGVAVLAVFVSGCGSNGTARRAGDTAGAAPAGAPAGATSTGTAGRRDASLSPSSESDGSPAAAAAVIRDYYAAIAAHDYRRAYAAWERGGAASGQTLEAFQRGFDSTAAVSVRLGEPGRIEGAAGSRYIDVPVRITARTVGGGVQHFRGTYTLRRAVVPGATAEQRTWHIYSAHVGAMK